MPFLFLLAPLIGAILGDMSNSKREGNSDEESIDEGANVRLQTMRFKGYDPFENKTWILEHEWKITEL